MNAPWPVESDTCTAGMANHQSFIGRGLFLKGEITGSGSLLMDGVVEGSISLRGDRVTLGRHSHVAASVSADEVVVHGEMRGNLRADRLAAICSDGSMTGDVNAARILIEDGAFLKGNVDARQRETETSAAVAPRQESSQAVALQRSRLDGAMPAKADKERPARKLGRNEGRQSRPLAIAS